MIIFVSAKLKTALSTEFRSNQANNKFWNQPKSQTQV